MGSGWEGQPVGHNNKLQLQTDWQRRKEQMFI